MKKIILISVFLLLPTLLFCSCGKKDMTATGLRDIKWGMTRTEIRKIEQAEFVGYDENFLRYYDTDVTQPIVELGVNTYNNVDLLYYFNGEDKLYKIEYRLKTTKLTDKSYNNMKVLMTDVYGAPYLEDAADKNDENTLVTAWKNAGSDIKLSYYNNKDATRGVMYVTYLPNN